jgi:hypothetical protein
MANFFTININDGVANLVKQEKPLSLEYLRTNAGKVGDSNCMIQVVTRRFIDDQMVIVCDDSGGVKNYKPWLYVPYTKTWIYGACIICRLLDPGMDSERFIGFSLQNAEYQRGKLQVGTFRDDG